MVGTVYMMMGDKMIYSLAVLCVLDVDFFLIQQGWNVLHRACAGGNIDTLKWLLELRTTLHSNIG